MTVYGCPTCSTIFNFAMVPGGSRGSWYGCPGCGRNVCVNCGRGAGRRCSACGDRLVADQHFARRLDVAPRGPTDPLWDFAPDFERLGEVCIGHQALWLVTHATPATLPALEPSLTPEHRSLLVQEVLGYEIRRRSGTLSFLGSITDARETRPTVAWLRNLGDLAAALLADPRTEPSVHDELELTEVMSSLPPFAFQPGLPLPLEAAMRVRSGVARDAARNMLDAHTVPWTALWPLVCSILHDGGEHRRHAFERLLAAAGAVSPLPPSLETELVERVLERSATLAPRELDEALRAVEQAALARPTALLPHWLHALGLADETRDRLVRAVDGLDPRKRSSKGRALSIQTFLEQVGGMDAAAVTRLAAARDDRERARRDVRARYASVLDPPPPTWLQLQRNLANRDEHPWTRAAAVEALAHHLDTCVDAGPTALAILLDRTEDATVRVAAAAVLARASASARPPASLRACLDDDAAVVRAAAWLLLGDARASYRDQLRADPAPLVRYLLDVRLDGASATVTAATTRR